MKKITIAKKNPLKIFDIYRKRVNTRLQNYLSSIDSKGHFQSELKHVMSYSILASGKRFRPILTYTTASLYNIDLIKVKFITHQSLSPLSALLRILSIHELGNILHKNANNFAGKVTR